MNRRRQLILALGASAFTTPRAYAQSPMPRVAVLIAAVREGNEPIIALHEQLTASAQSLGLSLPQQLLARADKVIS